MIVLVRLIATYAPWLAIAGAAAVIFYLVELVGARRAMRHTLFGLEREAARQRLVRAALMLVLVLSTLGVVGAIALAVAPRLGALPDDGPLPTPSGPFANPPPTDSPTPVPSPSVTPTRPESAATLPGPLPSVPATEAPTPEETPTPAPTPAPVAGCGDANQYLTSPPSGSVVSGIVPLYGTADIPGFEYYKFEVNGAPTGGEWVTTAVFRAPVRDGQLGSWDTAAWAPGPYQLRLVVVDNTGNFPTPCVIDLTVQGSGP